MPRTQKQNEKIRNKRKEKILNESLHLFVKKPYRSVSIDDIAKEVGCTHSLIYHYYASKEEVFHEVLLNAKSKLRTIIDPNILNNSESPKEILNTVLSRLLDGLKSNKREDIACSMILILDLVFDDDLKEIMPPEKRPFQMFKRIVKDGQKKGEFVDGDPREYAVILNSFLRGVSIASLSINKDKFIAPSASIIMRMLVREEK